MLMSFGLRLTGYYGDSPAEEGGYDGYRVIKSINFSLPMVEPGDVDAAIDAVNVEEKALSQIDSFISWWVTAERFECYTLIETERQRSFFRYELLRALTHALDGTDDSCVLYRYEMTDESCFVSTLRLYNTTDDA
jgi:hypothetical protein